MDDYTFISDTENLPFVCLEFPEVWLVTMAAMGVVLAECDGV